jgi:hypothetical protein
MKVRMLAGSGLFIGSLVLFLTGEANHATAQAAAAENAAVFVDAESPEFSEIRAHGDRAITRVGYSLVTEVTSAVAKDGPEAAVEVCHLKALPLTGEIISGMPRITAVKRTSLKLRNPANAPDPAESLALEVYRKKIAADLDPPKLLLQRIERPGGKPEWRLYRPVAVMQQCLACHGHAENQSPGLRETLQKRYPKDEANGYRAGEWRGLIRVSVAEPAPPPPPAPAPKAAPAKKR